MSDELNCFKEDVTSSPTNTCEYKCSDGECISESEVCNGDMNCPGGEEEEGCDNIDSGNPHSCDIDNGGCDHICAQTGTSQTCSCEEGYKLFGSSVCKGIELYCKRPMANILNCQILMNVNLKAYVLTFAKT